MREYGTGHGRPTKFNPTVVSKVILAIKKGATYKLAAQFAGIEYQTFSTWMKLGDRARDRLENDRDVSDSDLGFLDFYLRVREAEGIAGIEWLERIDEAAAKGHWQAAAWKLERRYPNDYGRRDAIEEKESEPDSNLSNEDKLVRITEILANALERKNTAEQK